MERIEGYISSINFQDRTICVTQEDGTKKTLAACDDVFQKIVLDIGKRQLQKGVRLVCGFMYEGMVLRVWNHVYEKDQNGLPAEKIRMVT